MPATCLALSGSLERRISAAVANCPCVTLSSSENLNAGAALSCSSVDRILLTSIVMPAPARTNPITAAPNEVESAATMVFTAVSAPATALSPGPKPASNTSPFTTDSCVDTGHELNVFRMPSRLLAIPGRLSSAILTSVLPKGSSANWALFLNCAQDCCQPHVCSLALAIAPSAPASCATSSSI